MGVVEVFWVLAEVLSNQTVDFIVACEVVVLVGNLIRGVGAA